MIGSHLSTLGVDSDSSGMVLLSAPPTLTGEGRVGSVLGVSVTLPPDGSLEYLTYQWMSAGVHIEGAVASTYTVDAAYDLAELCCEVTATHGEVLQVMQSNSVVARYITPVGPVALFDEVLDSNSGTQEIDVSEEFIGEDLAFSVIGSTGVAIDPLSGLLTVLTDRSEVMLDLTISASNSGGVWAASLLITLEEQPQASQVLDFTAPETGLVTSSHGLPQGTLDAAGIWFSTMAYFDGDSFGNKRLIGFADADESDFYAQIHPAKTVFRNGNASPTLALDAFDFLTLPGWYLVTARLWSGIDGQTRVQMWRNELVSSQRDMGSSFDLTRFTSLGWSVTPSNSPVFGGYKMSDLAWGVGDPSAYHAATYNNGEFANPSLYDFESDQAVTLLGFESGTRNATEIDPLNVQDLEEQWSAVGSPAWASLAPAYVGGEFGMVSDLIISTVSGTSTLSVTSTLPSASWAAAIVDLSKVNVFTRKGFGSVSVDSVSLVENGSEVTAMFTLSRTIYMDEVIVCELEASWLHDADKNKSARVLEYEVENISTQTVPTAVSGISNSDISFDFDQPYTAGVTSDGVMWVLDSGPGVRVAQKYPLQGAIEQGNGSRVTNGTMRNPLRQSDNMQGYGSAGGYDARDRFDPSLTASFPQDLMVGDSLIGVKHNPDPYLRNGGRTGHPVNILCYQGLIVTDFVPSQDDFAPPLVGYNAITRPSWRTVDIASIAANLPSGFDTSGFDTPSFEILLDRIEQFHPALFQFTHVEMKREMTPSGFTDSDGYGVNFIATTGSVMLMLLSAESTLAQRTRAVRWIVHHYQQWYGLGGLSQDGGHNQGFWGFLVLGDYWANGGAGIPTLMADIRGNESTAFQITDQALLDVLTLPHDGGPEMPRYNELTEVSSVADNVIKLARIDRLSGSPLRDAALGARNLVLVRPSDGAEITVTGSNENNGALVLATPSHGLSVGDVIYLKAPWMQQVGDYEWALRFKSGWQEYSPSSEAVYRNLNQWSAEVLVIQAFGLMHPTFDPIRGYVEMANTSGEPVAGNVFPQHHNVFAYGPNEAASGNSQWVKKFWSLHWSEIKAIQQQF